VRGRIHQSSNIFSAFSRGRQCTQMSYFAVLYSSMNNVDRWTPETIDFVLSQGDSMYNSVAHTQEYFDYTELPLSILLILIISCPVSFSLIIQTFFIVLRYFKCCHQESVSSGCYSSGVCGVSWLSRDSQWDNCSCDSVWSAVLYV